MSNRKLALLTTADNIGGMERIACGLAREFKARAWQVQVAFPRTTRSQALLDWCRSQGVAAEVHPALLEAHAAHSRRDLLRFRRFVKQAHVDVVNLHYGESFISLKDVLATRSAGPHRCICSIHTATPWDSTNVQKRKMTRLAALFSHAVIANSNATRDVLLAAGVPGHKIHRIHCGLRAPSGVSSREDARARLRIPHDAFVVATACRLVPRKGVADLIAAAARVVDKEGQLLVMIAGDGPERNALERQAADRHKDRFVFLGTVQNVDDLYAAADIFVLPSYLEGFGVVFVEAAFHGVPSIGTDIGGVEDVIVEGETGFLVPPGDPPSLADAIQQLQDDPGLRRRLGEAARTRAHARFTEKIMADGYQEVFER